MYIFISIHIITILHSNTSLSYSSPYRHLFCECLYSLVFVFIPPGAAQMWVFSFFFGATQTWLFRIYFSCFSIASWLVFIPLAVQLRVGSYLLSCCSIAGCLVFIPLAVQLRVASYSLAVQLRVVSYSLLLLFNCELARILLLFNCELARIYSSCCSIASWFVFIPLFDSESARIYSPSLFAPVFVVLFNCELYCTY